MVLVLPVGSCVTLDPSPSLPLALTLELEIIIVALLRRPEEERRVVTGVVEHLLHRMFSTGHDRTDP